MLHSLWSIFDFTKYFLKNGNKMGILFVGIP